MSASVNQLRTSHDLINLVKKSDLSKRQSTFADIAVISLKDFEKMKRSTDFNRSKSPPPKENFHKQKLIEIDELRRSKNDGIILSDIDLENQAIRRKIMENAKIKLENEYDDVKQMNKIIMYSQVASVRDRQIKEKEKINSQIKARDLKLDLISEVERLKDLKQMEEKENYKIQQRKQGVKIILDQISDINIERKKQKQKIEADRVHMLEKLKEIDEKEKRITEEKKAFSEKIQKEAEEFNQRNIEEKLKKKKEEIESNNKIMEYLKKKAEKEEIEYQDRKKQKEEKEAEIQRLREIQEKAQDKNSILNEFRAKRAFEDAERHHRERQIREEEIRKKKLEELLLYNNRQKLDKELQMAEQAKVNQEEFARIIQNQMNQLQNENQKIEDRKNILVAHNQELRRQIKEKEEFEKLKHREMIEEGRKIRQKLDSDKKRLEEIQNEKINLLKSLEVDKKYIVDLEKYKVLDDSLNLNYNVNVGKETKKKNKK